MRVTVKRVSPPPPPMATPGCLHFAEGILLLPDMRTIHSCIPSRSGSTRILPRPPPRKDFPCQGPRPSHASNLLLMDGDAVGMIVFSLFLP